MLKKPLLILFTLVCVAYANTLRNGYALDDDFVTESSATIKGLSSVKEIFTTHYIENKGGFTYEYRPMVKLSFALEHQLFGAKPLFSHIINLVLYVFSCYVLFKLLLVLFRQNSYNIALISVCIFCLLPVHTEVVTSLKNRDILLCGLFGITGLYYMLKDDALSIKHLAVSFCCFVMAYLCKLDALGFTLLAPVLVIIKSQKRDFKKALVVFTVSMIAYGVLLLLKKNLVGQPGNREMVFFENPLIAAENISSRIITAFFCVGFYIKQIIFPKDLVCYYGYDFTDFSSLSNPLTILGIACVIGFTYIIFKFKTQRLYIYTALAFFIIFTGMYSNIPKLVAGVVADRYAYFSSIGMSIFIALLFTQFKTHNTFEFSQLKNLKYMLWIVAVGFCFLVMKRNTEWKDRLTLYEADIKKEPASYKLITLLATEKAQAAQNTKNSLAPANRRQYMNEAYSLFQKAQLLYSKDHETINNLGYIEMNFLNKQSEAIGHFKQSLLVNNRFPETWYNLAISYKKNNQPDSAKAILETCIRKFPEFEPARLYLSNWQASVKDTVLH